MLMLRDRAAQYARQYGINPDLFARVIQQESAWNPRAKSPAGAYGLTQIMPATARSPGFGVQPVRNIEDTDEQLRFGAEYLSAMLSRYGGDQNRALAAYNWGAGNADRWDGNIASLPQETRGYLANITGGQDMRQPTRVSTRGTPPSFPQSGGEPAVSRGQEIAQAAALAFNQLRSDPDRNLARQFQSQNQQARQSQAKNRTVEWLRSQGREDLAGAVEAGTIGARDAFVMTQQRADPVKGVNINGKLVNPVTGDVIGDFSEADQPRPYTDMAKLNADLRAGNITREQYEQALTDMSEPDMSAAEEKLAHLQEITNPRTGKPFTREEAIQVSELFDLSRDPVTGQAQIINRANGQIVGGDAQRTGGTRQGAQSSPAPSQQSPEITYGAGDASDAFGAEGLLKSGINAAGDFVGLGTAFPDVQTTSSDFATLREQLLSDIASAYPRQPPSWLMQEIRQLTPAAGSGQGANAAQSKLRSLDRYFDNEMQLARRKMQNAQTPQQRAETEAKLAQLQAARKRVSSALAAFGGAGTRGKTSSGVEWEILE